MIEAEVVPWHPAIPEPDVCRERVAKLRDSEREVLELMALGYAPKQIARMRGTTAKTAQQQICVALQTLNVAGRIQGLAVLRRAEQAMAAVLPSPPAAVVFSSGPPDPRVKWRPLPRAQRR